MTATRSLPRRVSTRRAGLAHLIALSMFALLMGVVASCARDNPESPGSRLAVGEWGADGVRLLASDTATVVNIGCSGGTFPGNIALDASGHFAVNGNWQRLGGAFIVGDMGPMPAQMSGQVSGNTVVVAVAVTDTVLHQLESIGPSTAVLGVEGKIVLCP